MKYVYMAIAFAIVAITIWFVWNTPPCGTGYSISTDGFKCNSHTLAVPIPSATKENQDREPISIEVPTLNPRNAEELDQSKQPVVGCTGAISTLLIRNVAKAGRYISVENNLQLHVLAVSDIEADLAIRKLNGDEVAKFTMRVADNNVVNFNNFEYRLTLNLIDRSILNNLKVNVTMHKVACV